MSEMLTPRQFLERVTALQVSRKGNRRALYKPLLLLVALGRVSRGVLIVQFADIEGELRELIARYSAEDSPDSVGQPWWHLPTDALWQVTSSEGNVLRKSGTPREDRVPSLGEMRTQAGGFPPEVLEVLTAVPGLIEEATVVLLDLFFSDLDAPMRAEVRRSAGLSVGGSPVAATAQARASSVGRPYSNIGRVPDRQAQLPFEVDPDEVDRANQAHASTVDALADFLRRHEIEPLRPAIGAPLFDLAWVVEEVLFVAEIKSLTEVNEEKQLRLGLGQVLRYRQILRGGRVVVAVLVPERQPADSAWGELCGELGVVLIWPEVFGHLFNERQPRQDPAPPVGLE